MRLLPRTPAPLSDVGGPITPGIGAGSEPAASGSPNSSSTQQPAPGTQPPSHPQEPIQATPPELPAPGEGSESVAKFIITTTYVEVPVTVKDSKGNLVAGLTWRDFRVFENGKYEPLKVFTVDPMPLSIAFVIDQSLTSDVMARVNESMGAIQGRVDTVRRDRGFLLRQRTAGAHRVYGRAECTCPSGACPDQSDRKRRVDPPQQRPDGWMQCACER
jgi:hypothetical protein